ncbi:ATPase, T2SS/T4P/T4SS family [Halomicrococcus gelatinilyticus]|uniref:ATPase, T2SS/T4P/T4SS family n=1 Tax=Halomicrococcus gelatinilyticus TaxID=1702103 RepID=UPI002E10D351
MWDRLQFGSDESDCACEPTVENGAVVVDADDCPGTGDLVEAPACRATVVGALAEREADRVVTRASGVERAYEGGAAALLVAAGRFAERVAFHDADLAERAKRDPLGAALDAVGRAGPIADAAAETGLAAGARRVDDYADALRPFVGPTVARSRIAARPPANAVFDDRRTLPTGATVRVYARPDDDIRTYHLEPAEHALDRSAWATLERARDLLADGGVGGGRHAPSRAVRRVADDDDPVDALAQVLAKHTRGYGVLGDLFADPALSDVFATAPVTETRLRATVDGERVRTNVRLTRDGAEALASRFRRTSGRSFSRASPTLDATADVRGRPVRVAGVTDPVSDGVAFAFRAGDDDTWRLPELVANHTLPADAAALLSLAVERAAAGLVAGTRGAGKTTLLGALLWELPAATRTVVLEDTPELPVEALQAAGRDVQALRTSAEAGGDDGTGLPPTAALRTALRLGEGALVVGEVRGEEAGVLYEAMRVGANGSAVLGTIHGDGGAAVRERVVEDLGVSASSFAATDLVVTLEPYETDEGRARRVKAVEEVVDTGPPRFEPLYELRSGSLAATGRIDRGNSVLVEGMARSAESYADVLALLTDREAEMRSAADATDATDVTVREREAS